MLRDICMLLVILLDLLLACIFSTALESIDIKVAEEQEKCRVRIEEMEGEIRLLKQDLFILQNGWEEGEMGCTRKELQNE